MVHIIWTTPGDHTSEWESTWLCYLFGNMVTSHVHDPHLEHPLRFHSVIVINPKTLDANVATSLYLKRYETAGIPFGLIHLSDEFLNCDYRIYQNTQCQFVYRNYWHPVLCQGKVKCFPMGYKIGFTDGLLAKAERPPTSRPNTWCFSGNLKFRHPERVRGLQVFQHLPRGACVIEQGDSFSNPITGLTTAQYQDILSDSAFALCPPGNIHLDSFRMYEALEAGAIPVTLACTPQQPQRPSYWAYVFNSPGGVPFIVQDTWEDCLERVKYLLSHPTELDKMQKDCKEFWETCKERVRTAFRTSFEELFEY